MQPGCKFIHPGATCAHEHGFSVYHIPSAFHGREFLISSSVFLYFPFFGYSINTGNVSGIVRKPTFCICENKDADQLPRSWSAPLFSLLLVFLNTKFAPLAISSGCTARFVRDLVRIHIVCFPTLRLMLFQAYTRGYNVGTEFFVLLVYIFDLFLLYLT